MIPYQTQAQRDAANKEAGRILEEKAWQAFLEVADVDTKLNAGDLSRDPQTMGEAISRGRLVANYITWCAARGLL